jgi:hypothetical protein
VTVGERGGRMCLCSVVVVVATALLPILHQSTTQANLSFVVSNKSTTVLLESFSFCSASNFLYSFLSSVFRLWRRLKVVAVVVIGERFVFSLWM